MATWSVIEDGNIQQEKLKQGDFGFCDSPTKETENTFHFAARVDNLVTKEEVDVMYLDKKPSKFEQDVPERVVIPAHSTSYPILIEDIIKKLSRPII